MSCVADLRDLSRPIRKRSHYPTLQALQNALHKTVQINEETRQLIDSLMEELNEILEHACREQLARSMTEMAACGLAELSVHCQEPERSDLSLTLRG